MNSIKNLLSAMLCILKLPPILFKLVSLVLFIAIKLKVSVYIEAWRFKHELKKGKLPERLVDEFINIYKQELELRLKPLKSLLSMIKASVLEEI